MNPLSNRKFKQVLFNADIFLPIGYVVIYANEPNRTLEITYDVRNDVFQTNNFNMGIDGHEKMTDNQIEICKKYFIKILDENN